MKHVCGNEGDIMRHLGVWCDWRRWIAAPCPGCGQRVLGMGLCAACAALLDIDPTQARCGVCTHPLVAGVCPDCGGWQPAYDRVVVAFDYQGLGRELIRACKFQRRLALVGVLADRLAQALEATGGFGGRDEPPPDWVTPVPAHRAALRQRGFSPPAEVARLLARRHGLRYRLDLVRRADDDAPRQASLGRAARLRAPVGAFVCPPAARRGGLCGDLYGSLCGGLRRRSDVIGPVAQPLAGARVAVVDDVMTTGATLQAVALALKAAGAAHVEGWVLARTVRR